MRFADDAEVNLASRELALQCLLPVSQMRKLIKYLYYENLFAYSVWTATEDAAATFHSGTTRALTRLLAEHLCLNDDTR